MSPAVATAWALAFMALALLFARWVEQRQAALAGWLAHPLTYMLALSTYFTAWAYFGTGAAFFQSGISYLSHEIGWSFLFLLGWPLLLRAVAFARSHGVTTLPGFLAVRYGPSRALTGLLVGILVLAMLPYVTLQLHAIAFALETVSGAPTPAGWGMLVPLWATLVAGFAVLFGGLEPDPTRRLPGVFATLAVAGGFKLAALLAVAGAAWWHFGPQFGNLTSADWPSMRLGSSTETSYMVWMANMVISMAGVLLLPHMFHLGVIEAREVRQVTSARWTFPLYGWIFEVALVPITLAGVLLGLSGSGLQAAVLTVPQHEALRLIAFLGGVAAASGMAIITLIALANMLLLDLLLPVMGDRIRNSAGWLVPMRAGLMVALAIAATVVWHLGEHRFLFELGLVAFVALAQIAPAFFGGLVWPQLNGRAIGWGLGLASGVWLYTALLPSLAPGAAWVAQGPWGLSFLRPHALLGVEGLPPAVHAFLWCSLANLVALWAVMATRPSSAAEVFRARSLLAGDAAPHAGQPLAVTLDWAHLQQLVASFMGPSRADEALADVRAAFAAAPAPPARQVLAARDALERVLRGPLGPAAAMRVVDQEIPISSATLQEVMHAYYALEHLLALSQEELADRIQELTRLKEELETRVEARTQDLAAERDRIQAVVEDLRNLERLKSTFVNAVSHDLRIPLTGIMGYAEFLEDEVSGPLTEDQLAYVNRIMEAARRMTSLLNALLDYARLEAGQFTVEAREVPFTPMLDEAANTFMPVFERKRLRFELDLAASLPAVSADPERVIQVLSNLLSNAAKFTPEGGRVTVHARPEGPLLLVEVEDTGVGIPPEALPHLFDRFYQTPTGQAAGGTGLGLHICKTLIEAQGGQIGVRSMVGLGTVVWFTLPLVPDKPA